MARHDGTRQVVGAQQDAAHVQAPPLGDAAPRQGQDLHGNADHDARLLALRARSSASSTSLTGP